LDGGEGEIWEMGGEILDKFCLKAEPLVRRFHCYVFVFLKKNNNKKKKKKKNLLAT
jgi:hypothetical protein